MVNSHKMFQYLFTGNFEGLSRAEVVYLYIARITLSKFLENRNIFKHREALP